MSVGVRRERLDRGIKVRTEGIYAISHWQEMLYLLLPRLVLIVGLLIAPVLLEKHVYWQRVLCLVGVYALLSIAFDFLANFTGLVNLGGALFAGVGGYLTAIFNKSLGLPLPISFPLAVITGALTCTCALYPVLRLRGVYFAVVTLIYPLFIVRIIEALNILGGTDGIVGISSFQNRWVEAYLILLLVLTATFSLRRLVHSDIGLVIRGVKDNDQAVRASGIDVTAVKAGSVFIAAVLGCAAGAYLAHLYMWAGLSLFALDFSILPIATTVIGGGGTIVGPVVGSIILVPLAEWLRAFGPLRVAVFSIVLVVFILARSEGLMNWAWRKYHQFERWVRI